MNDKPSVSPRPRRRAAAAVVITAVVVVILVAVVSRGGGGSSTSQTSLTVPAPRISLVVQFKTTLSRQQLNDFPMKYLMTCNQGGRQGCAFNPPLAGAVWDYPESRITFKLQVGTSQADEQRVIEILRASGDALSVSDDGGTLIASF
jgi:hypothetical protein